MKKVDVITLVERARQAQASIHNWNNKEIDEIVAAAGWLSFKEENARRLVKMAVQETCMGNVDDGYNRLRRRILGTLEDLKSAKTSGVVDEDPSRGVQKIAKPVGLITMLNPATAPTASIVCIALSAIKTRNSVIFCSNPRAKRTTLSTVNLLREALRLVNAPPDLIQCLSDPDRDAAAELMATSDLVLATGGRNTVRRVYSSGTPAYAGGVGNAVVIVDETADVSQTAQLIVNGKASDNGTSCSAESCLIVENTIWSSIAKELSRHGAYFCSEEEASLLKNFVWPDGYSLNRDAVGKSATAIANQINIFAPSETRVLVVEGEEPPKIGPFCGEKLSPVLAIWKYSGFDHAITTAKHLLNFSGMGHSAAIHTNYPDRVKQLASSINVGRLLVNQSTGAGNSGSFDNGMPFSMILSCGTWGGSVTTRNITWRDFLNYMWISRTIHPTVPEPKELFGIYWARS